MPEKHSGHISSIPFSTPSSPLCIPSLLLPLPPHRSLTPPATLHATKPLRLPTELVCQILSNHSSTDFDEHSYRRRQDILLSCCLVSKQFYAVARELLWQVVRLESEEQVRALERALTSSEFAAKVRTIVVQAELEDCPTSTPLASILRRLRSVDTAHIEGNSINGRGVGGFAAWWLSFDQSSLLRNLSLEKLLWSAPTFPLPHLTAITLHSVSIDTEELSALLHPRQTPSLRAIRLSDIYDHDEGSSTFPNFADPSLARLDCLQIDPDSSPYRERCTLCTIPKDRILFSHALGGMFGSEILIPAEPLHLHINLAEPSSKPSPFCKNSAPLLAIRTFVGVTLPKLGKLRTLSLPFFLANTPRLCVPLRTQRDAIVALCEQQGVEVHYRIGSSEAKDFRLNEDFWRYAKARRVDGKL